MQFWSLKGYVSYAEARELQHLLVDLRARDFIPDTFLFLEHLPVITQGRGLQWTGAPRSRHMPVPQFLPSGVEFSESERGGDLTYHGPGQLVVYPICKLDGQGFGPARSVAGFLRKLEGLLIHELSLRGLEASSHENATGIWLGQKKLASIGIAVRKWVTYHGIAINCVNALEPFQLISPCGFSPDVMTRLSDWVSLGENWRTDLEQSLARNLAGVHSETAVVKSFHAESLLALLRDQAALFEKSDHPEKLPALNW